MGLGGGERAVNEKRYRLEDFFLIFFFFGCIDNRVIPTGITICILNVGRSLCITEGIDADFFFFSILDKQICTKRRIFFFFFFFFLI